MLAIRRAAGIALVTVPERWVPLSVALQSTVALPLASIMTLDSVTFALESGNGDSTADAAAMMFDTSVLVTDEYCDAMSATVLATSVTWRSALIASVTSRLPKIHREHQRHQQRKLDDRDAALVRREAATAAPQHGCKSGDDHDGALNLRFVAERRGRDQRVGVVGRIDEAEDERRGVDRPLIDQPDHDDVAGIAGLNRSSCWSACRWRWSALGRLTVLKFEKERMSMFRLLEHLNMTVRFAHIEFLNCAALMPEFCACPVRICRDEFVRCGLQHLAGEQHDRGFDDRHQDDEERQHHQRKIDRRATRFVPPEAAFRGEAGEADPPAGDQRSCNGHSVETMLRVG